MAITVGVEEAKSQLSGLLAAARRGQDVVIERRGKDAVRLVPVEAASGRPLGFLAGPALSESFFEELPDR